MLDGNTVSAALGQAPEMTMYGVTSMLKEADVQMRVISSEVQRSGMFKSNIAAALADPLAGGVVLLTWEMSS